MRPPRVNICDTLLGVRLRLIFPPNQLNVFVGRISIGFVLKIMKVSQQSTLKTHRSPAEWFNMRNQVESRGNKVAINSTCVTEDNWNQLNRIIITKCVMDFPCLTCCWLHLKASLGRSLKGRGFCFRRIIIIVTENNYSKLLMRHWSICFGGILVNSGIDLWFTLGTYVF